MAVRFFRQYILLPFLVLAGIEIVLFSLAYYLGLFLRLGFEDSFSDFGFNINLLRATLFALSMLLGTTSMGLYQSRQRQGNVGTAIRLAVGCVFGGLGMVLVAYLIPDLYVGRGVLAFSTLFSFFMAVVVRIGFMRLVDEDIFKRRVLVYGAGEKAGSLSRLRRRSDKRGFKIVGYIADGNEAVKVPEKELLEFGQSLPRFAEEKQVAEILLAVDDRRQGLPVQQLLNCKLSGIDVIDVIDFFERETGKVRVDLLYPSWLIFAEGFTQSPIRIVSKRVLDIVASAVLLAMTWPIMLITVLVIKIEDGMAAPVFYRQERVGAEGEIFELVKFRSMHTEAEVSGEARWATKNDSRITRVGKIIRKLRIDELPQILNVLHGDMAFVGPRPERPEFVSRLAGKIPYYSERHFVKPGITGWAQLCYPYGSSERDALEKLQYDLFYLKNHNLLLDLQILIQTAEVIFFGKGAR